MECLNEEGEMNELSFSANWNNERRKIVRALGTSRLKKLFESRLRLVLRILSKECVCRMWREGQLIIEYRSQWCVPNWSPSHETERSVVYDAQFMSEGLCGRPIIEYGRIEILTRRFSAWCVSDDLLQ